ncbi:hypothetical protein [Candidatus Magnetaquicoccus inordinatus]|uniref:hypothetical protein n=1 Tax=Candidatus Magnetaquicoccus inordinatus TaxID=2496818 RepID=UPI00102C3B2A|nr:hypothetical protein [Candidatus Magnetaquicoccus inordinatus]
MKTRILAASALALLLSFSATAHAADNPQQPKPFDETEFSRFLTDYPTISKWVGEKGMRYGSNNSPWALSGLRYDKELQKHLQSSGWNAERFFYLLDHINLGLMTTQAEAQQESMRARMNQQQEKAQAANSEEQKKAMAQMQEQQRSSLETARAQWSAQRERVANDPYIPHPQKQQILAQMDRSQPSAQMFNPEQQQEQMRQQQQNWLNQQKQQISNNPYIPPGQKQEMLAQLERSREAANPGKAVAAPTRLDPVEQQNKMQAQHKQWLEERMKEIRDNPMMPAVQKQQMLDQLQLSLKNAEKAGQSAKEQMGKMQSGPLPAQESQLIKSNRQKLTTMFFPEM